jgi:DNA-binding Lrp family transcriptional regulator
MIILDEKDRILLNQLQKNSQTTIAELARLVTLSPSGVQKRVKRLEENGVIAGYRSIVDRQMVGYELLCFVLVMLQGHDISAVRSFDAAVQQIPEVLECHRMTGSSDYLLKLVARSREHLDNLLMSTLMGLEGVARVETSVVLKEVKETTAIPLDEA